VTLGDILSCSLGEEPYRPRTVAIQFHLDFLLAISDANISPGASEVHASALADCVLVINQDVPGRDQVEWEFPSAHQPYLSRAVVVVDNQPFRQWRAA
jgi:hypothetical protein